MKMRSFFGNLAFANKPTPQINNQSAKDTEIKAKEIILQAQEKALAIEKRAEDEGKRITQELVELEKKVQLKEANLENQKKQLEDQRQLLEQKAGEISTIKEELIGKLEKLAKLSSAEARELVLKQWEEKLRAEIAKKIKSSEEEIKLKADDKAKEILIDAIRYGAVGFLPEYTLTTVTLPSDDFKGRIIGKEGRNIRAFELATGVDVDLEEEGIIKFSSFDAVRREVAKVAMERLIRDGRIQPERIEEIVEKTQEEIDKLIVTAGEEVCH